MLDLHLGEKRGYFRNQVKIVFEEISLKHSREIFGDFLSFMEAALEVVCNFSNVWDIDVFVLFIIFGEL